MQNSNPLAKYFRQPAIYIRLPSDGRHYPANSLEMPENGELPVYPMTAMDEISYRTSDALFNGSAVIEVIKSCVPNIIDPWQMPSSDLDSVLIGIRIASYGHELELENKCPSCSEENTFVVDLRTIAEQLDMPDYGQKLDVADLEIHFKPISYKQMNQNTLSRFEDQKMIEMIPTMDTTDEEKLKLINASFAKLGKLGVETVAQGIDFIVINNETVSDRNHILQFIQEIDRKMFDAISKHLTNLRKVSDIQPMKVQCHNCEHAYDMPFTLDVSNFFA